jgi:hypothetical protein
MPTALAIVAAVQWVASPGGGPAVRSIARAIERRLAGGARLVAQQTVHAGLYEALLPAPDHRFALASLPHDRGGAQTVCREEDDLGAPDVLLRAVPVGYDRCQSPAINSLDVHHDPFAHSEDSHVHEPSGILIGTRLLGRHH